MWSLHIILCANFMLLTSSYTSKFHHGDLEDNVEIFTIREPRETPESFHSSQPKRVLLLTGTKSERALALSKLANRQSRIVKKINFMSSRRNQIYVTRGVPAVNYPIYHKVPRTNFRCSEQIYPGYYADVESGCQAFHMCDKDGRTDSLLCPNGTIFNQHLFTCDWWYNVDCTISPRLYHLNGAVMRQRELHSPKTTPASSKAPGDYASASQQIIHLQALRRPRPRPQFASNIQEYVPQASNIKTVTYPSSSSLRMGKNSYYSTQKSPVNNSNNEDYKNSQSQSKDQQEEGSNHQAIAKKHLLIGQQQQQPKQQFYQTEETTTPTTTTPKTRNVQQYEDQDEKRQHKVENVGRNHRGNPERQFNRNRVQTGQTSQQFVAGERPEGVMDTSGDHFRFGPTEQLESHQGPPDYQIPPRYRFGSERWGFNDWDDERFANDGFFMIHV